MKNKIALLFFCLLALQAFTPEPSNLLGGTVHVLVFVENNPCQGIYESCQKDRELILEEMDKVREYAGMQLKFYTSTYNKSSMEAAVAAIHCQPNDVIIFFYSGHGYNRDNSEFPCLNFNEGPSASRHINLSEVHDKLKGKGSRLVLTIGDCCNAVGKSFVEPLSATTPKYLGYSKLFLSTRGDVLVASCRRGQFSEVFDHGYKEVWAATRHDGDIITYIQPIMK